VSGRRGEPADGGRPPARTRRRGWLAPVAGGALLGLLVLHPFAMAATWFELRAAGLDPPPLLERLVRSAAPSMAGMSLAYAGLGAALGAALFAAHRAVTRRDEKIRWLSRELALATRTVIEGGEDERTELKSTLRWDLALGRTNKDLERAVVTGLAGLMNHRGGSLIVGVADDGSAVGLEADYASLRRRDRDGFQQRIFTLVREHLGAEHCPLVHPVFGEIEGRDVCRLVVERSPRPVFLRDGRTSRYFLRTGNATRELDARETMEHLEATRPAAALTRRS